MKYDTEGNIIKRKARFLYAQWFRKYSAWRYNLLL